MNRQQAVDFVREHSDDDDLDSADIDAAFTAIFEREPDDEDRDNGLWSMMIAATNDDPACEDDEDDEDENDEPKREKYITINDDIDYWGAVPADFDMDEEIAKITNAAEDAGIVVYDGCKPSQETVDRGKEIDWSTEWCYSYEWNESQWVEWFRKQ